VKRERKSGFVVYIQKKNNIKFFFRYSKQTKINMTKNFLFFPLEFMSSFIFHAKLITCHYLVDINKKKEEASRLLLLFFN
jgi:hypothetical protein